MLAWPDSHLEWIRPGIIMYGISPFADQTHSAEAFGMQPVMTLTSSVIAVRTVKQGEAVGYGGSWVSERDTKVGVVAIGYGDGYPRTAPNGTPVLINGRLVPIAGRVSMDMLTVDLGPDATDQVGDEAILWGQGLPAEVVADHVGTIAYELVTKLTSRVAMAYR
ncbi:alanine racemase [Photobacterium sp. Hal280]|uniref:alanine racemase n=1 Tax=Photobacterium sp. Hal280 TaxID=3035163 RepID=UPI003FA7B83D